jgi:iron uptake system component EfeO
MNRIALRPALAVLAVGALAMAATACGSSDEAPEGAVELSFKLTDAGCVPHDATVKAGPVEFEVENAGTSAVDEFEVMDGDEILAEKENLTDGLSGSFSLTLEQGSYTLYCPGGRVEKGTLTVR